MTNCTNYVNDSYHLSISLNAYIIMLICQIVLTTLFGSINLTLSSITLLDLNVIAKAGEPKEKIYANALIPLETYGHFLLCAMYISHVLLNCFIILTAERSKLSFVGGFVLAVCILSVFGGVIPYALSSRFGLAIAARSKWLILFLMVITAPLSYPFGRLIDNILGPKVYEAYNRDKLREFIREEGAKGFVNKREMSIITGALSLSTKTVSDIMTKLDDCFMIQKDAILDFETMTKIVDNGFTRVPVFRKERNDICGVLNVKDLAFIDPNDKIPLKTVYRFYERKVIHVDAFRYLDSMLAEFCQGKAHMAFVCSITSDDSDELVTSKIIGLVTLEDVIEEILQAKIIDETDVFVDNTNRRRLPERHNHLFQASHGDRFGLSPQMKLTTCQHLSTHVSVFSPNLILVRVLECLLNNKSIFKRITFNHSNPPIHLYDDGKHANYAILILQGKVRVHFAREKLVLFGGPFMFFGEAMLIKLNESILKANPSDIPRIEEKLPPNIPDYTMVVIECLEYILITRAQYAIARQATLLKKTDDVNFT